MKSGSKGKYSQANLIDLMDDAIQKNGSILIQRPGKADLILFAAERLRDVDTTEYLLASSKNRARLLGALKDARASKGRAMTVQQLRKQVKLNG